MRIHLEIKPPLKAEARGTSLILKFRFLDNESELSWKDYPCSPGTPCSTDPNTELFRKTVNSESYEVFKNKTFIFFYLAKLRDFNGCQSYYQK